jgi:hypothetical protein
VAALVATLLVAAGCVSATGSGSSTAEKDRLARVANARRCIEKEKEGGPNWYVLYIPPAKGVSTVSVTIKVNGLTATSHVDLLSMKDAPQSITTTPFVGCVNYQPGVRVQIERFEATILKGKSPNDELRIYLLSSVGYILRSARAVGSGTASINDLNIFQ